VSISSKFKIGDLVVINQNTPHLQKFKGMVGVITDINIFAFSTQYIVKLENNILVGAWPREINHTVKLSPETDKAYKGILNEL